MTTPDSYAIVRIPVLDQVRPAAHVFTTPDGIAWLEPGYLLPEPAVSPYFHRLTGTIAQGGDAFDVLEGDQVVARVLPAEAPGADDEEGTCAQALAAYGDALLATGRTQAEERERVERELGPDLG